MSVKRELTVDIDSVKAEIILKVKIIVVHACTAASPLLVLNPDS